MMMNTYRLQGASKLDLAQEQRMLHKLEKFALTLLCVGVASTFLTVLTTLNALAAQPSPAHTPSPTLNLARPGVPPLRVATTPDTPGVLKALQAADTAQMNTEVVFNFAGTGHCKLMLDGGDGSLAATYEGDLPFTGTHYYSSTSMSSFDSFKDYTATATPSGNCKISRGGPFTANVRIVNPHPQSAGAPAQNNTMVVAGDGKLSIGLKPGTATPPAVAATITSLAFASGPSLSAGSPTVLTVNGTGICKYHLSYVNLDAQGKTILKPYPMMPKNSSIQSPFPMTMTLLATTPVGVYTWTATGVDGCTNTANATLTVQ